MSAQTFIYKKVRRTLFERLFSLTPWRWWKQVRDHDAEAEARYRDHEEWVRRHHLRIADRNDRNRAALRACPPPPKSDLESGSALVRDSAEAAESAIRLVSAANYPDSVEMMRSQPDPIPFDSGGGGGGSGD